MTSAQSLCSSHLSTLSTKPSPTSRSAFDMLSWRSSWPSFFTSQARSWISPHLEMNRKRICRGSLAGSGRTAVAVAGPSAAGAPAGSGLSPFFCSSLLSVFSVLSSPAISGRNLIRGGAIGKGSARRATRQERHRGRGQERREDQDGEQGAEPAEREEDSGHERAEEEADREGVGVRAAGEDSI